MDDLPSATCADCVAFRAQSRDEDGIAEKGICQLRSELGPIPTNLPACESFRVRSSRDGKVKLPAKRRARRGSAPARIPDAPAHIRPTLNDRTTGDTSGELDMDREGLKQVLRELLEEETLYGYPEMGARWEGGTMVLKPYDSDQQPKEVPIETFFHKIVMVRDRLRVLESKLNSHNKLSEQEKVEFQSYITKCYGTLTTFNVLFKSKSDQFSSK